MASLTTQIPGPVSPANGAGDTVLRLEGVSKLFGAVRAVNQVTLDIHQGEVLTLLGPSGCGKTTTLRMVIGLERCDEGTIIYDGKIVDAAGKGSFLPTHKRNMGMVFQSYAIWPHMTVFENVAYPLRVRRVNGRQISESVDRVLEQVGLTGFASRPATMLSGGQQQRVALARSLVFEPKILLLDEPFSNLDAKLREHMRAELKVLQRRLGITVLLVTHDQVEALSLSDRIAVMRAGNVEQIGSPVDLYRLPKTEHVRDFLGRTIVFGGELVERPSQNGRSVVALDGGATITSTAPIEDEARTATRCFVAVRPEQVEILPWDGSRPGDAGPNVLSGVIEALLFIGDRYEARIALPWGQSILVLLSPSLPWREGQHIRLSLPPQEVRVWGTAA